MIRFLIVVIFLILFLILSMPVLLILWIIGRFHRRTQDIVALRMVQWAFSVILKITGVKATYIGWENVPKDEPVLYVGNHRSFFDILLTYVKCPDLTGYVAKKEMLKAPLLNIWMKFVYCLFLDRANMKEGLKTILVGIEQIKRGISMTIFPEGTRNKGEELSMLPFKAGALKMAEKTGCPIIPMSINNSSEIFENHFPRIRKTHVIIEYGTPIYPKELDKEAKKHLSETCQSIIQETINRNAERI